MSDPDTLITLSLGEIDREIKATQAQVRTHEKALRLLKGPVQNLITTHHVLTNWNAGNLSRKSTKD